MDDCENRLPRLSIALEYSEKETTLNFYIKKVVDAPLVTYTHELVSKARIYVVKGVGRRTWMGRHRTITEEEILGTKPTTWETLTVRRCETTIFNEFFSCPLDATLFHRTMLRIQLCDVDTTADEGGSAEENSQKSVVVAETDFWVDSSPILQFVEFEIPMQLANPDLGELEFGLTYLLTAERVVVTNCVGTNLRLKDESCVLFLEATLYVKGKLRERHRSERRDADFEQEWTTRLLFDVPRKDVFDSILLISLYEMDGSQRCQKIGRVGVSFCSPSTDHSHWHAMLRNSRTRATQIHKLAPAI
ncbi:unnamed protein product, partial [Mesorhabditis spiculigera]